MLGKTKQAGEIEATSDAGNGAAAAAQTQAPTTVPAFEAKAKDLQALRDAVIDAASVGAGLWLSYLFVLFYLAIAVGSVTHRNLFFESPVKLPFLNVDLPLIGFFVLGPGIFLVVHAYVLLHFVLLAGKVGVFHTELQEQIKEEEARTRLRRQLPSNIFVQFLAGPREVRTGIIGLLLRLIAQISLVAGPLALLVFFQLQFLPYHHEAIAWWQRLAVIADLALLWTLWPSVGRGETIRLGWRDLRRGKVAAAAVASLAPIALVFAVATFPGEWLDEYLPSVRLLPLKCRASDTTCTGWATMHELLVGGDIDFVAQKPTSVWSNRLVLPGIDIINHANSETESKTSAPTNTLSMRGRRLEGAVLIDAHLKNMDFTAARLQDANFTRADLRETTFECAERNLQRHCAQLRRAVLKGAQLQSASLRETQLEGAILDGAQLQGATLNGAQLRGARLDLAQLQGARLEVADLQGVSLDQVQLQGAELNDADLRGATLSDVQLQAASLRQADLRGATLSDVQLQGASLFRAHLQGATLAGVQLQGAFLDEVQLQGALLDKVQLQGASLENADLRGATLGRVFVWRADVRHTLRDGTRVVAPLTDPIQASSYEWLACRGRPERLDYCFGPDSFAALRKRIEQVPKGPKRDLGLERIAILDPEKPLKAEEAMPKAWNELAGSLPTIEADQKALAVSLRETGCEAAGAPYVIRALLRNLENRFALGSNQPGEIAAAFLDEAECPGARRLSEDDKAKLLEIRASRPLAPTGEATP